MLRTCLSLCTLLSLASAEFGNILHNNASKDLVIGDHLTIHIVAHTHDDPGWLITVDQYYVEEVEWIFYTVIPVLMDNPIRRFTYVEMSYMHRWWQEIDDDLKADTVKLIDSGQLQMNLGGWCMNDEASPTASAVIHQMSDGNQFIIGNLGMKGRPTVGWHVDPFGHSWVTGGMWAQAGFDCFAVHRINYMDLAKRKAAKNLEFIWQGSSSLGPDGYIFFHVLDSGYCSPHEITFWDGGSWITVDPLLPSWPPNQVPLAEQFIAECRTRSQWFKHDQLLMPFGCDFAHQNSYQSFIQMDKLIEYVNGNSTYNATIVYSSLADYVSAVNDLNLTWSLETPDFFTYVDHPHAWWSGYFTSRAYLKLYVRSRMNDLRVAEQMYLFGKNLKFHTNFSVGMYNISYLRDAVGVVQHHDALTGTEKDFVAEEYMNQLSNGTERVNHFEESIVGEFLRGPGGAIPVLRRHDMMSELTNNNFVVMVIYNSLAWNVSEFLTIPSNRSDLVAYDSAGNLVKTQINAVCEGEQRHKYPNKFNMFILAENIQALTFETFFIGVNANEAVVGKQVFLEDGETFKAGSGYYTITIDGTTQRLSSITNNGIGMTSAVENQFAQYKPSGGIYYDGDIPSGAYIFRPATDNRLKLKSSNNANNIKETVVFRQELMKNPSPGFIVTTHCNSGQFEDTFTATVCGMDTSSSDYEAQRFEYEYYRANGNGWGQDPLIDFVVFDSNNAAYSQIIPNQEVASQSVSKSASSSASVKVTFTGNYATVPRLFVSVRNVQCDGSQFVATITDITNNGATVYIERIDSKNAWNNNVFLDYMVYASGDFQTSPLQVQGQKTVTISASKKVVSNLSVAMNVASGDDFFVNEPIVLVSVRQISPVVNSASDVFFYAATTYDNSNRTFQLNLYPINPSGSGNVELQISYVAFQRITLYGNVTDTPPTNVMITGPLMDEVQQSFKSGYSQTLRVFNVEDPDLRFIDNRIHIGPIDQGAEFITKFTTDLSSDLEYFTNQAGLEYVRRQYFPYWDEPIAANYYPSSGASYIADSTKDLRFSTIVSQGHGVGSLRDGEFEMMLQRRCLQDDQRGVSEVLNTTFHTEPQVMILLDNDENVANLNRRYFQIQQFEHMFYFGLTDTIADYTKQFNTTWTAMSNGALPENIFLMQLRYGYSGNEENGGMVMQLQNIFETGESSMAKTTNVDLNGFLRTDVLNIDQSTEMNLLSTIPLSEMQRLPWNIKGEDGKVTTIRDEKSENKRRDEYRIMDGAKDPTVALKPRDIRTFVINEKPVSSIDANKVRDYGFNNNELAKKYGLL